jgi:hypothetical protein
LQEELSWLKNRDNQGKRASVDIETLGGLVRHSDRQGQKTTQLLAS